MKMTEFMRPQHLFDVNLVFLERQPVGPLPRGVVQEFTAVDNGVVTGPRLSGRVVSRSGVDYSIVRPDGVVELDTRYLLEADDGTLIGVHNTGYEVCASQSCQSKDRITRESNYFYLTPRFMAPEGPHGWLTRTVIVGRGERRLDARNQLDLSYFALL
jgi:hypothetical protein